MTAEEQPDGIADDSTDLPDPARAAERVNAFLAWFGDGLVGEGDDTPLYARDLQALANAAGQATNEDAAVLRARLALSPVQVEAMEQEIAELKQEHGVLSGQLHEIRAALAAVDGDPAVPVEYLADTVRAVLRGDTPTPALRVFFPGDTVPAGTALMLDDGSLLEADTGAERWDINDGVAVELLGIPTREEWQAAVDRARDARADAEWQHTEGTNP
ncbi:hypothetical protein AB0J55_17655 [Amycolatopsis sp. NPDC049688]|uniref:hypothetical protein n=1 Tax=Amycolatopsis sp. NPDC049688 TaxID=3154733 RepID=UPI003427FE9C